MVNSLKSEALKTLTQVSRHDANYTLPASPIQFNLLARLWQARFKASKLVQCGVIIAIYFLAGKLGLVLASLQPNASPVWPPAGIALATLLLLGYRMAPAIFVGAFLVNITAAGNVATSFSIATGNTLEALVAAWLVNRFANGKEVFDHPQGVFKFAVAAAISTTISPAFGVTSLALGGFADWTNYGSVWLTWWLGDATSDLVVTPLILLWSLPPKRSWNKREALEISTLLLLLPLLGIVVFGGWFEISLRNYPGTLICGPIVIWTAFRFTQRETATGIFLLSGIAIWGTLHGFGPFIRETENQSLIALQLWIAVLTITALALSAGMTDRKRVEEALREALKTKDRFLASVSHELRTPLTPVLMMTEILQRNTTLPQSVKGILDVIGRNTQLEAKLVNDLLDFSRGNTGKLRLELSECDVHKIVERAVRVCSGPSNANQLKVVTKLNATHQNCSGDPTRLQQVFWNLIQNAIKSTSPGGSITISSRDESGRLCVDVSDTGCGIEPAKFEQIFEPFVDAGQAMPGIGGNGGLGLGLAIARQIVIAHGGTLVAASDGVNRGATFTVSLPASRGIVELPL